MFTSTSCFQFSPPDKTITDPIKDDVSNIKEFEVRIFLGLSRCLNSGCGDEASDLKIQFITHCGVTDSQNQFRCEGLLIKLIS